MKNSLFVLGILCLSLFSCTNSAKTRRPKVKEISTNFIYSPFTLDPRKGTDPVSSELHFMLYEGLTHLEADGTLSLALADAVEISKDRRTYTFYLKKSCWSDGTPLTARDFEASWKTALSPEFPSLACHLLFPIKNAEKAKKGECSLDEVGVRAVDDETLVVKLEHPTPYFMELTAYTTFFPVPNQGKEVERKQSGSGALVCNGPFELLSWKNEDEILVKKNPLYRDAKTVKIDQIRMTIVPDERTALQLFEKGQLDWIGGLISPLPIDAVTSLSAIKQIKIRPIAGTNFCVFNTHSFPFNNVHIRKAFAYAINRQLIVDNVTQMFDEAATSLVPPVLKDYKESHFFADGDSAKARRYFENGLVELGIGKEEFPGLAYSYFSTELQKKLALALQSQWREVLGVEVKLEPSELKVFLSKLHQKDFQFGQMSWIAQYNDQMSILERFRKKDSFRNYSNWESAEFQHLISSSYKALTREKRYEVLEKAEEVLLEEMPMAPIYHYNALYLSQPHVKNAEVSPLGHVYFHHADIN